MDIQKEVTAKNMLKMQLLKNFLLLTDLQDKSKDISAIAVLCSHIWGQANDRAWTEPGDSSNDPS